MKRITKKNWIWNLLWNTSAWGTRNSPWFHHQPQTSKDPDLSTQSQFCHLTVTTEQHMNRGANDFINYFITTWVPKSTKLTAHTARAYAGVFCEVQTALWPDQHCTYKGYVSCFSTPTYASITPTEVPACIRPQLEWLYSQFHGCVQYSICQYISEYFNILYKLKKEKTCLNRWGSQPCQGMSFQNTRAAENSESTTSPKAINLQSIPSKSHAHSI